ILVDGRHLLASGSIDKAAHLWDPATRALQKIPWRGPYRQQPAQTRDLKGHTDSVTDLCAISVNGRELLATASRDRTVRLWDPRTGDHLRTLEGHTGAVTAVCPVAVYGHQLLASAGDDRMVRLWKPDSGSVAQAIPIHFPAHACVQAGG